ncbi:hypothetical protein HMPREF0569_1469 [Micrococcus luteus SK58]|nr:hypothetical protein HMPREF0569_1469 [Micrococcus luteus SK58]
MSNGERPLHPVHVACHQHPLRQLTTEPPTVILPDSQLPAECPVLERREQLVLQRQCPLDTRSLHVDLLDDGGEFSLHIERHVRDTQLQRPFDVEVADIRRLIAKASHGRLDSVTVEPGVEESRVDVGAGTKR